MVQALLRDFQDVEHATTLGWIAATSYGAGSWVSRGAQRVLPGSSVIFDVQPLCGGGLHGGDEAPGVRAGPVDVGQVVVLGELDRAEGSRVPDGPARIRGQCRDPAGQHRRGLRDDELVRGQDRKSTRLNCSHVASSYA